jgi:fumarate hydratase subunit alpha
MIREISDQKIEKKVEELCYKANVIVRPDVRKAFVKAFGRERSRLAKEMLKILMDNTAISRQKRLPLCQDTGLTEVFAAVGRDVHISGKGLARAVDNGVERAYTKYNFRKSVVLDPLTREYKSTNTPAILHTDLVKGDRIKITVMPKGFGSENKSRISMLNPTAGEKDIVEFCVKTVVLAGPDACPPYILGVGIGGTMERCALLSKKALLRPIDKEARSARLRKLEKKILKKVNSLGIGVMGFGGASTALAVNVAVESTHIAGLPVAVSLSCHSLRSASGSI